MKVEFFKHSLGSEELASIQRTLQSRFLTYGPESKEFESELAAYLGV